MPLDRFIAGRVSASSLADEKPEAIADRAIAQRPEIKSGEIGLANKQLSLLGTRSALKPTFDVYVSLQNNALAGQLNRNASAAIAAQTTPGFIGGFGTLLDQMGRAAYPDYAVGFQLNLPIVNRAAQSDMARDQIDLRQMQISLQTLRNGVRLQAIKSALALRQARQQYELSLKTRKLLEQGLSQEQKMFDFGTSDPDHLEAAQARLDLSRVVEITSLNTYARAQVNLEAVLNQTLEDNNIVIDKLGTEK